MRFLTFEANGRTSFGAINDNGVVDLGSRHDDLPDLRQAIREDRLQSLAAEAASADADYSLDDIIYLPPIPNPEKIMCVGVNYANRNAEYKDGSDLPKYPSLFMRSRESLTGHLQPILDPPESDQLDYEGEIVMIIGKDCRRVSQADAHTVVAGLTIMNEGSLRDYIRHGKFNVTPGKNFESSGSVGPWIVTADELDPMSEHRVTTHVNGEERQNDTTESLMFPFRRIIEYLTSFCRLKPGDVIATGTPNGAGARFDPPKYLKDGDVVEVEVSGIGTLKNTVQTEVV
ncbi:MAG: fumarylacetoacetate hydrolase family protein [Gammaproteobacteria bacterium]|nr:fumarylacetoacetate hydrolase family protein [Gammaproteobacteria bacterium]